MHQYEAMRQAAVMNDDVSIVIGCKALSGGRRLRLTVYRSTDGNEFLPVDLNIWLTDTWPAAVSNACDMVDDVLTSYLMHRFGLQGVIISR